MRIKAGASKKYDIIIKNGILKNCGDYIKKDSVNRKILLVTDSNVAPLYLDDVKKSLIKNGFAVLEYVIPAGEKSKNITQLSDLLEFAAKNGVKRGDFFLALGGGVVGDLCGFAASVYMRGIDYINIPTTVVSQTDSSIGGKTAVNLEAGKNLAGTFYPPFLVLVDSKVLNTLPDSVFSDGMAEVIKYGCIRDENLFNRLETGMFDLEEIITQCINIKCGIVNRDEFDRGERMLLNFGHTIGHALEKTSNYSLTHGEAVSVGMNIITRAAEHCGLTEKGTSQRLKKVCEKYNLPCESKMDMQSVINAIYNDKKSEDDFINLILLNKIGQSYIKKISFDNLRKMLWEM